MRKKVVLFWVFHCLLLIKCSQGEGFATGIIDLGGLSVTPVSNFTKIWATHEGGPGNLGATFSDPSALPDGYFSLGSFSQPNNKPLPGWALVAKDGVSGGLKAPIDYTLAWSSESVNINQDGVGYIWHPTPPDGYQAIGHVVTSSPVKPPLDKIRCVRADFVDVAENGDWIWGSDGISLYGASPRDRGRAGQGVPVGAFFARRDGQANASSATGCLKNKKAAASSAMPNLKQIQDLITRYGPLIYFHPDEEFFPSSTSWFFDNGALLYTKGQESNPVRIDSAGSNLPRGGTSDGSSWIDLPADNAAKERVKKGNVQGAKAYIHVKPMFGSTFTDLVFWIFYPFNGAAKAKFEMLDIDLGKIGEHVGDWEHLTLRISNFDGEVKRVYFSQHSRGTWVDPSGVEYVNGYRLVWYSSRHGHAAYPKPGDNLQGSGSGSGSNGKIGIRNDTGKGPITMDTSKNYEICSAEHLGSEIIEPPWLNYAREWGPKVDYDAAADEIKKVEKALPGLLRKRFEKFIGSLPNEVLGEQGPTGPKWKDNWDGDERS